MPQVKITPWRRHGDLLAARAKFYQGPEAAPAPGTPSLGAVDSASRRDGSAGDAAPAVDRLKRDACDQVHAWRLRGGLPHAVDATAALTDAVLNDHAGNSSLSVRGAYASAFVRFITGLMDIAQTARHKRSMYAIAVDVGVPERWIDLRHQIAHAALPNLSELRRASAEALEWLWESYWAKLPDEEPPESLESLERRALALGDVALKLCRKTGGEKVEEDVWIPRPIGVWESDVRP